jgi:hypothetical protein
VRAFLLSAWRVGRFIEPVPKLDLCLFFLRILAAAVIEAEVVIVPGGDDGLVFESPEETAAFQQRILLLHHRDAALIRVDVVAHENEKIAWQRERAVEHGMLMRVEAGAEEDVFERFRVLGVSGKEAESRKSGEKAAAGGFEHGEQVKTRPGRRITHASGSLLPHAGHRRRRR